MGLTVSVDIRAMRYPDSPEAEHLIQDLTFTAPANSVTALLGRSGVGKTTLLRMIAGLEQRFDGAILVDNNRVAGPVPGVQLVFQDYRLLPWKTVYGNVEFAAPRTDSQADAQRVAKWLKIVGLFDKSDAWPKTLSGGESGRVAFARAFVSEPGLLLLDEPFSNLDMIAKFQLQDELQQYLRIQATTVILVSHSIDDVVFLSDTIHVLSDRFMNIDRTFTVPAPRPRRHGDAVVDAVRTEIIGYLQSLRDRAEGTDERPSNERKLVR